MKNSFWSDAALFGAFLGLEEIVFSLLEVLVPFKGLGFIQFVVFIALLVIFTKRRAALAGSDEMGYSYGKCLQYIICMSLFAGVLMGAYSALAANFFFPEKYHEDVAQTMSSLAQVGYPGDMLRQMQTMLERTVFSPVWVLFSYIFSYAFKGLLCGLIVAAFAKRNPQLFGSEHE